MHSEKSSQKMWYPYGSNKALDGVGFPQMVDKTPAKPVKETKKSKNNPVSFKPILSRRGMVVIRYMFHKASRKNIHSFCERLFDFKLNLVKLVRIFFAE